MGRRRKEFGPDGGSTGSPQGSVDGKSLGAGEGEQTGTAVLEPEDLTGGERSKEPQIEDLASGEVLSDADCREKLTAILRKRAEIEQHEAVLSQLKEACAEAGKAVGDERETIAGLRRDLNDIEAGQKLLFS